MQARALVNPRETSDKPQPPVGLVGAEASRHTEEPRQTVDFGGPRERQWRGHSKTPPSHRRPWRHPRTALRPALTRARSRPRLPARAYASLPVVESDFPAHAPLERIATP